MLKGYLRQPNPHFLWLGLALLAFLTAVAFSQPMPSRQNGEMLTPTGETPLPTAQTLTGESLTTRPSATPIPEELIANREQTFGIVFGAVVLVLIVVVGTMTGIAAQRQNPNGG